MNETEIIQGARELLTDPKRWHKGGMESYDRTAVCLVGALDRTTRGQALADWDARYRAEELIEAHLPPGHTDQELRPVADFNDAEQTTHADVLNILDKCLADLGALA